MIGDADKTLLALLRDQLDDVDPSRIAVISPEDAVNRGVHLGLFPYRATEQHGATEPPALRNEPLESLARPLSWALELHYLVTGYGSTTETDPSGRSFSGHQLLARAMRVLHDYPVVPSRFRQGALDAQNHLRVILDPITVEEMTRVWSLFPNAAYQLSVSYLVGPVEMPRREPDALAIPSVLVE